MNSCFTFVQKSLMKLYKDYEHASITMVEDKPFLDALKTFSPLFILETGTYLGTGSTKMLASLNPKKLYTIECSHKNYSQAKENLKEFPFIECLHGLSVHSEAAKSFMERNPQIFQDDVFIDDANPLEFYTNEIMGMLSGGDGNEDMEENILERLLPEIADYTPLILLDSAGGIGFFEFLTVREIMKDRPYILVLDDTHHVKHHRSKMLITKDPAYQIVYNDDVHGRLIAVCNHEEKFSLMYDKKIENIYVILGRFGDIYMVAKKLKQPSIIACLDHFSGILEELFPEHTCIKMKKIGSSNPYIAKDILSMSHPTHNIIVCQQDGTPLEQMKQFRSFQTYQEYYASSI